MKTHIQKYDYSCLWTACGLMGIHQVVLDDWKKLTCKRCIRSYKAFLKKTDHKEK